MSDVKYPTPTAQELAAMKARILADPYTAKIAETLGKTLDEYMAVVMKYLANPALEPQLKVYSDEDLREAGLSPVKLSKVVEYVNEHVEAMEISVKSKFADPNSKREKVTGAIPTTPAATARPNEVREDLKEEIERSIKTNKIKKI